MRIIYQVKNHKIFNLFGIKFKFEIKNYIDPIFLNNEIYFDDVRVYNLDNKNIFINVNGNKNIIKLNSYKGGGRINIDLRASKNATIEFGKNNQINSWACMNIISYPHPGCDFKQGNIFIGDNNLFNGDITLITADSSNAPIIIGNDNLFSGGIELHASSDHTIYNKHTKKVMNVESGILIQNHNWVCMNVKFFNKARIGSDCVVGAMSLVNKNIDNDNSLIAGVPAFIKKENINWRFSYYAEDTYVA